MVGPMVRATGRAAAVMVGVAAERAVPRRVYAHGVSVPPTQAVS